jgi:hypothetical protein
MFISMGTFYLTTLSSFQQIRAIGADRKFDTTATRKYLEQEGVYNGICCGSGKRHQEKLKVEKKYGRMVKRRAQIKGRIGILKNVFLPGRAKSKGYEQRKLEMSWAVLAHNLWVIGKRGKWKEPPAKE